MSTTVGSSGNGTSSGSGGDGGFIGPILGAILGVMAFLMLGLLLYYCCPSLYSPVALLALPGEAAAPAAPNVVLRRRYFYRWTFGRKRQPQYADGENQDPEY
jgi:hypothetical protein